MCARVCRSGSPRSAPSGPALSGPALSGPARPGPRPGSRPGVVPAGRALPRRALPRRALAGRRALPRRALAGRRVLLGRAIPGERSWAGHRWTCRLWAGRGGRLQRRGTRGHPGYRPPHTGSAHPGRASPTRSPDGDTGRTPPGMPRCGDPTGCFRLPPRTSPQRRGGARVGVARTRYTATRSSVPPGDEARTAQAALGGRRARPGRRVRAARTGSRRG